MVSMAQTDPCSAIMSRIAACGNSSVPVPALSRLLGVKTTTLNARFRRELGRLAQGFGDQAVSDFEFFEDGKLQWHRLVSGGFV
jgi:hypothetical protein